ncbi:MAG TPA: hypothetical protein PLB55_25030 [Prosthecobacter sp.]|jgi:hypothetical protein|nr:hypothetical protein [Prosthecobacter sp.]
MKLDTKRWKTVVLWMSLLVFGGYVISYIRISARGRFEPEFIGLNGVKRYGWAPDGFVSEFKWDHSKLLFYYPLHFIDTRFFHTNDDAYNGRFPINEIPTSEIGKVYRAWGL